MDPNQNQTPLNSSPLPPLNQSLQTPQPAKSNFGRNIVILLGILIVMVVALISAISIGQSQVKTKSEASFRRPRKMATPMPSVSVVTIAPSPTGSQEEVDNIIIDNFDKDLQDIRVEMNNL